MIQQPAASRRILLASIGTYGDVFPFLSLGKQLLARGHDVTLLTSSFFKTVVEDAGLKIAPVGTAEQYHAHVSNPHLVHPIRGLLLTAKILHSVLEPVYEYIRDEWQTNNSIIVASPYCMGARIAQETLNIRLVTVALAPLAMGSTLDPPAITAFVKPTSVPKSFRSHFGRSVHWVTDRVIGRTVNKMRSKLGLRGMHKLLQWWHSPVASISLFPEWFAQPSADWPINHTCVGFPATSCSDEFVRSDNASLNQFLSKGRRTILFYPGSNASHVKHYFSACAQVCDHMGYKGIFVAPAAIDLNNVSAPHMHISSFVPMDRTLRLVQAAVHHGGIGTIVDCLKAGVPQLIRPMFGDQYDNATHVTQLGVGTWLSNSQFRVPKVRIALEKLLSSETVASKCLHYQSRIMESDGLENAVDLIESFPVDCESRKSSRI